MGLGTKRNPSCLAQKTSKSEPAGPPEGDPLLGADAAAPGETHSDSRRPFSATRDQSSVDTPQGPVSDLTTLTVAQV